VLGDNADARQIGCAVATASREAQDMLLLYFAGHSLPGGRRDDLYLALQDTDPELPALSALPFNAVHNEIVNSPAAVCVMIVDCCFSGRAASLRIGDHFALAETLKAEGLAVLTASPANTVAMVGAMYSEFTTS
jgi:uncharacterized caspase-like protein